MSESMDLFAPSLVAHFWPREVIKARIIAIGREQVARLTGEKARSPITTSAGLYDLTDGRNGPPHHHDFGVCLFLRSGRSRYGDGEH
jgi:hypothetical protein